MPKASDNIKIYRNPNGPVVSTVNRRVLEQDGLTFKDIDGTGTLSPVNDWRNSPAERAAAYVKTLSVKEKIAQLFISDWRMVKYPITGPMADLYKDIEKKTDETGILDEGEFRGKTIFGEQYLPGTSTLLKDWFNRHVILRANATPADLADWMNQADAVCEECEHFIPVAAASNSRNENGELVFGMNDAGGVLATWPGTLGIAAAVKGSKIDLVDKFADTIRREWNACGLRKGYMYMADAVTDPRWQRTYGTFGEDPALISEIMAHIIPRIQGSDHGVTEDGVAVTTKHFPGGGARENGFDPHYAAGQWNVYATPGSLETYHLPPFAAAVKAGTSSIMPYYSKPAATKSAVQHDLAGNTVEMKPYGFAYNKYFIDTMLRGQMGFDGYINSDTGIAHNMAWGVEMLDVPERIGFAVANAGVDIISGLFDNEAGMEAYNRGKNGYYETHPLPEGFAQADFALLFVSPSSGEYFNATPGYLELDICEDKTVCNVDANGKPMADTHTETTLHGGKRLSEIAASVHANGGKVITNVNITLAWQLGNVEPLCDVLLAGFDTYRSATLDVIFGCFAPTGKLPLTLPRGDAVLAVNADGVCISPNDVPGYDKDRYMPDSLKDENGKAYAYRDAAGNYYEYGFGLEG